MTSGAPLLCEGVNSLATHTKSACHNLPTINDVTQQGGNEFPSHQTLLPVAFHRPATNKKPGYAGLKTDRFQRLVFNPKPG